MNNIRLLSFPLLMYGLISFGQGTLSKVKTKTFKTISSLEIEGDTGYLIVPENRTNPSSREIKVKYVHLKSLSESPATPVIYLEGGGGESTWQADSPEDLTDWVEVLEIADLIFIDRRGINDNSLNYIPLSKVQSDFFSSEEKANEYYSSMVEKALSKFQKRKVDVSGYNIVEHAKDIHDLTQALEIKKYSIYGFSYGTHIGMTNMVLHPEEIERAVFIGADAPNQSFNFPSDLDRHVEKISEMVAQDSALSATIPSFRELVNEVMEELEAKPVNVIIKHPLTKKKVELEIGAFGLALVLRLDIDDANDIPAIPRLLYTIHQGDYSMLTWFVQKRASMAMGLSGSSINQGLASGVSSQRWSTIKQEAEASIFGNIVNFPFSAAKDSWPNSDLEIDTSIPVKTDIPTLFVTGTLDCRTSVEQVEETMKEFSNAIHVKVKDAGHEQAMWQKEIFNEIIPSFLKGQKVSKTTTRYREIKFLPLAGSTKGHPSIK
ncbi:MAG: alpha/beta hydrolase [Ekhidna sp.]